MNFFERLSMKLNKPYEYVLYKQMRDFNKIVEINDTKLPLNHLRNRDHIAFKHAGNSGDIIYALPTLLAVNPSHQSNLYLHLEQSGFYRETHPLGTVMLNEKVAAMLMPLLQSQPYLGTVEIYKNQSIDYDLDILRDLPLLTDRGDISRWYFQIFGVFSDLSKPWLHVTPDSSVTDYIVIARSERYNNTTISYSFLKQYKHVAFVGLEKEFNLMRAAIPHLEWQPVKNFLEMAQIIAGGKFFIGNQSFPYSMAEAMKVNRILEVCFHCPNVVIHGERGYDFYFQKNFEDLVRGLYTNELSLS
jgi:hypothetical protein